jgi:hypothetical protein
VTNLTAEEQVWEFDRYTRGELKAEGIRVTKAQTEEQARQMAARMAYPGDVLIMRSAPETQAPQAPIALLTINMASEPAGVTLYAPGLPPGDHQLYCEPEKVAPYMRAPETSGELLLTRNALGNLYMAVLKFGPIDRDIQFAMNEAGQLLGSPIQVKEASGGKHG